MRLLVLLAALLASSAASGHTRSYSYSLWELGTEPYQLTVRINQLDLTRLQLHPDYTPDYNERISALVTDKLQLKAAERVCDMRTGQIRPSMDGWVQVKAVVQCAQDGPHAVTSDLLLDVVSSHMHFVTVKASDGQVTEKVLTEGDNRWLISSGEKAGHHETPGTLGSYWLLGIGHILTGWDHLAFVFGLMLLATSLAQLAWLVTGFTIAHSITLALAAMGHLQPLSSAVEALIGLSILLVAIEHVWEKDGRTASLPALTCGGLLLLALAQPGGVPAQALVGIAVFVASYFAILKSGNNVGRWRLLIAFAFGLFHGFGFAGILAEMSLPESRLLTALFGFNIGVETGQLVVVALLWPLLNRFSERAAAGQWIHRLGTTAIAGLGTFWFITRAFI